MGKQQGRQGGRRQMTDKQDRAGRQQNQQNEGRQQSQQNEHGEGNYAASRQYDEAAKDFAHSGRVESAAQAAAPRSDAEAMQMQAAEAEGKRRAKGEDPALLRKASEQQPPESRQPRPGDEEE
ncbi:MAG TPA: hypothetical protein VF059_14110 [Casimicrobiaceae bacterium]